MITLLSETGFVIVLFLDHEVSSMSMLACIRRLKSRLPDFIEPDFGLLEHLVSEDVLNARQYDKIRAGDKAAYERSQAVLDLLKSEDQCGKFLKALQETGQQHVANFISRNGGQNDHDLMSYKC